MKKIFMLLMIAGTTVMFASCDSNTTSTEETVVASDTVSAETEYEIEKTAVEVDTTTETETETIEHDQQQ